MNSYITYVDIELSNDSNKSNYYGYVNGDAITIKSRGIAEQLTDELVRYTYNYESSGIHSTGVLVDIKYKTRFVDVDASNSVKVTYSYFGTIDANVADVDINIINALVGDVNDDGIINASDTQLVLKHASKLINLTKKQLVAADVNDDGIINSEDAGLINQYAARLIDSF